MQGDWLVDIVKEIISKANMIYSSNIYPLLWLDVGWQSILSR